MRRLIALVLAARVRVVTIAALFLIAGSIVAARAPLDVLPDFAPPQVVVQTEARGLDPELVERLVTRPVENALNGAPGVEALRSESIAGLSVVTLNFSDGSDPYLVRQGVAERVADATASLPAGIPAPRLSPLTSATMDVLKIGLISQRMSAMDLRTYAEAAIRPALLSVPGVARVNLFGGERQQIDIAVDPDRLLAVGLTVDSVVSAAQKALMLTGAGFVETANQRLSVKLAAPVQADLAQLPLAQLGARTIRLADVARVSKAPLPPFGDALIQGRPGVLITISSQLGASTLAVTRALEQRIAALKPAFEQRHITLYPALHRPASFLTTSLTNLRNALLLGVLFVAVVLLAFLRSWRAALVTFVAIPLSLLAAALGLWAAGFTINTMTLGGFAVALGVLVDDAIIGVENVMRRLRGRDLSAAQRLDVVLDASLEVRSPMIYATIVVLLVFVPVMLLPGVEGRLVEPLSWAFVLSVLASLVVALIVTPALAAMLLTGDVPPREPRWIERLRRWQGVAMERVERAPRIALAALAALCLVVLAFALRLPAEFVPAFREGHFVVQVSMAQPGVSLATMREIGAEMSRRLLALPFVATVEEQMGRAEQGEDTWPVDRGEFHVELKPDPSIDQDRAQERIREVIEGFPGLQSEVLTFLGDRISETLTGETSQVVIAVYGDDLDALDGAAQRIAQAVAGIDGVTDLVASGDTRVPELRIVPNRAGLAAYAVDVSSLGPVLDAATQGISVGALQSGELPIPVSVRLTRPRGDIRATIATQLVPTASNGYVPFAALASLDTTNARATIRHEAGRRYTVVGFNVSGRSIQAATDDARQRIRDLQLPADVEVLFSGVGEAAQRSNRTLLVASAATLVVIALVLLMAFERRRHAALVLMNVPFALIGALGALLVLRLPLSLGAAVGLATIFGISARNAILLLSHFEQLSAELPGQPASAVAWRAAEERLVPVLMTALVAGLGLLPLAFGLGRAGHEIEAPLAIVVLGGLVSSTLLSLILVPALAGGAGPGRQLPP